MTKRDTKRRAKRYLAHWLLGQDAPDFSFDGQEPDYDLEEAVVEQYRRLGEILLREIGEDHDPARENQLRHK